MEGLVAFVLLGAMALGCVALAVWAVRYVGRYNEAHLARHRAMFQALARDLASAEVGKDLEIRGVFRGVPVRARPTLRSEGKTAVGWTEVEVDLPSLPVRIALRSQTADETKLVESHDAVDLVTGDREFDDAFIVEAAPADVARTVLDEQMRARLLALRPFELEPTDAGLRLSTYRIEDAPRMRECIEAVVQLGARMQSAVERADATLGYRGVSAPLDFEARDERRGAEIDALDEARERREQRARLAANDRATWSLVLVLATVIGITLARSCGHG